MNAADRSAFVVLGETGHGKTVLLVHLIQAWLEGAPGAGRAEFLPDGEEKRRRGLAAIEAFPAPGRRTTSQAVAMITRAFEEGHRVEGTQEPEDFFVRWHGAGAAPGAALVVRWRDVPGYVFEEGERWEQRGERWGELLHGCAGLLLVLDLGTAREAAEASRFAARVHRYIHALSAAEAAARRAGLSALPVALVFTRADLEAREVTLEELQERPALKPLFAALFDPTRRLSACVQIVSCLRLAGDDGAADRAALASCLAHLGAGLARGVAESAVVRKRRRALGVVLALAFLYAGWAAFAAWSLRSRVEPAELLELQSALTELAARERALALFGVFPWWPGKDREAHEAHVTALEARALALLRDHPALREEEARCERTRAEYATARLALERLRGSFDARAPLPPGPEPREELLRAKEELARLEPPTARNLHEWEAALRSLAFPALRARVAASLEEPLRVELEGLELASRKVDLAEELADLAALERFARAHAGLADELVAARAEREWEHVRFVLDRLREGGAEAPSTGLLQPLAALVLDVLHERKTENAQRIDDVAYEIGRSLAAGASVAEREQLAAQLASEVPGAGLAAALGAAFPRIYEIELLRWNGAEGRAYLTRRVAGLRDLAALLRSHATSDATRAELVALEAHFDRLERGKIGPYRVWLRSLVTDVGDEPFWMRVPVSDARGGFLRWNELGGLAQPELRLVRLGESTAPFTTGVLAPGADGWQPLLARWEGRVPIGEAFEHEAGRGLRLEIADRGTSDLPRPTWLAWVVLDAQGTFAPERLDARSIEVVVERAAGGTPDARDPEKRYQPPARQVLRVELEVELSGKPLRDASGAFAFTGWAEAWRTPRRDQ